MNTAEALSILIQAQLNGTRVKHIDYDNIMELVRLSRINQISYLVMGKLIECDISEKEKNSIRALLKTSVYQTLLQITELKKIEEIFETNMIVCQPMKGALLRFDYPQPEMREMSDIDILVNEINFQKGCAVLNNLGYALVKDIGHHAVFKNDKGIVVELHHTLCDITADKKQYEYFYGFKRSHKRKGYEYIMDFNNEDFYIYMLAHMARHFYVKGCGVRNLVDLFVYRRKYETILDWNYVEDELKELGLYDFYKQMNMLSRIWLENGEWTDFYIHLINYMLEGGIYGRDENGFWNKYRVNESAGDKDYRKQLKRWYYFPPLNYMQEYYSYLHKYPCLLPFAWIRRGINGLLSKDHMGMDKLHTINHVDQETVYIMSDIYQKLNLNFKR